MLVTEIVMSTLPILETMSAERNQMMSVETAVEKVIGLETKLVKNRNPHLRMVFKRCKKAKLTLRLKDTVKHVMQ